MSVYRYLITVENDAGNGVCGYADGSGFPIALGSIAPDDAWLEKTVNYLGVASAFADRFIVNVPIFSTDPPGARLVGVNIPTMGIVIPESDIVFDRTSVIGGLSQWDCTSAGIRDLFIAADGDDHIVELVTTDEITLSAATLASGRVGFESGDAGSFSPHGYIGKYPIDELSTGSGTLVLTLDTSDTVFPDYFESLTVGGVVLPWVDAVFDSVNKSWTWTTAEIAFSNGVDYGAEPSLANTALSGGSGRGIRPGLRG